jgi:hypothetical protein
MQRTMNRLRGVGLIPRGVYRFTDHEEADAWYARAAEGGIEVRVVGDVPISLGRKELLIETKQTGRPSDAMDVQFLRLRIAAEHDSSAIVIQMPQRTAVRYSARTPSHRFRLFKSTAATPRRRLRLRRPPQVARRAGFRVSFVM